MKNDIKMRAMQLMNSTKPKKTCRPRQMPMIPGTGKWMTKPEMIRKIIDTRLIQCVITNGIG